MGFKDAAKQAKFKELKSGDRTERKKQRSAGQAFAKAEGVGGTFKFGGKRTLASDANKIMLLLEYYTVGQLQSLAPEQLTNGNYIQFGGNRFPLKALGFYENWLKSRLEAKPKVDKKEDKKVDKKVDKKEVVPKTTWRERRQAKIRTEATPTAAKELISAQQKLKEVKEKHGVRSTEFRAQADVEQVAARKMEAALYGIDYDKLKASKLGRARFEGIFKGHRGGYNVDKDGKDIWQEGKTLGTRAQHEKLKALQRAGVDISKFMRKDGRLPTNMGGGTLNAIDALFKEKVVAPALAAAGGDVPPLTVKPSEQALAAKPSEQAPSERNIFTANTKASALMSRIKGLKAKSEMVKAGRSSAEDIELKKKIAAFKEKYKRDTGGWRTSGSKWREGAHEEAKKLGIYKGMGPKGELQLVQTQKQKDLGILKSESEEMEDLLRMRMYDFSQGGKGEFTDEGATKSVENREQLDKILQKQWLKSGLKAEKIGSKYILKMGERGTQGSIVDLSSYAEVAKKPLAATTMDPALLKLDKQPAAAESTTNQIANNSGNTNVNTTQHYGPVSSRTPDPRIRELIADF